MRYLSGMPTKISNIDTPAILLHKGILLQNLRIMQRLADSRKINLRVHIKTHKIPEVAELQLKMGAVGIAVAKLGEAEVMAKAGIKDIQIANIIVGENKIRRLMALNRICKISVAVDSAENAAQLSHFFLKEKTPLKVLLKINSGLNRCGLDTFDEVLGLVRKISALPNLKIAGLMTHAGHAYGAKNENRIKEIGRSEGKLLVDYARKLHKNGLELKVISVGSTPTAPYCSAIDGVTELRVGNYIFNDRIQVALGTVPLRRCALNVLATVICVPSPGRVIIDAGSKALALDSGAHGNKLLEGYGYIIETKDLITRLSEEHGIIDNPKGIYRIGQKLRIMPNHACTVMNLFDEAYLVDGDLVVERYKIAARGKMK